MTMNRFIANGGLGINLGAPGVTANDIGDTDAGANGLLNFPVLTAVAGGVQGTYNGSPGSAFQIEFYSSPVCDASGNGEGATFLTAVGIVTDGAGSGTIPFIATPVNQYVTATTTDASDNTSEFSACALVSPSLTLALPNHAADRRRPNGDRNGDPLDAGAGRRHGRHRHERCARIRVDCRARHHHGAAGIDDGNHRGQLASAWRYDAARDGPRLPRERASA